MKIMKQILGDFNNVSISSGLLGGIFGISTTLIMISTAAAGGFNSSETVSWVFSS